VAEGVRERGVPVLGASFYLTEANPRYGIVPGLRENDRSATGFLQKQEFEATADAFFAHPHESVRGWEAAVAAQARIVRAVEEILSQAPNEGDLASWVMAALEPCCIVISHDCQSIGGMTSQRRTEGTGSRSTV